MSYTNRRSCLARGAALAAGPTVAALATGVLADKASADTLPDFAPIPKSALGPAVNADGYYVGGVERQLYWGTDAPERRAAGWPAPPEPTPLPAQTHGQAPSHMAGGQKAPKSFSPPPPRPPPP